MKSHHKEEETCNTVNCYSIHEPGQHYTTSENINQSNLVVQLENWMMQQVENSLSTPQKHVTNSSRKSKPEQDLIEEILQSQPTDFHPHPT